MAASPDGRFLYPLLEGPLWDEQAKTWEQPERAGIPPHPRVRRGAGRFWTGRSWKYLLEVNDNNIGDFNMIDATTGLIIERDNGEGDARLACQAGRAPDCFNVPARFKRVYKIDLSQPDAERLRAEDRLRRPHRHQGPGGEGAHGRRKRRVHLSRS